MGNVPRGSSPASRERRSTDLLGAAERVLWPLVTLLMHRGIAYPVIADLLKSVFVRVAMHEFPPSSARETDSRLSVLTGIYRRDIKRLRSETLQRARSSAEIRQRGSSARTKRFADSVAAAASTISLSSMVIAVWTGRREYVDRNGKPRPLPLRASPRGHRSFESLVQSISKDVRPRALLDEWLRREAVTIDERNRVCLNLDVFMAQKDMDDKAFYFAQNVHDHLAAIAHNLLGIAPPFLERCTYYGQLTDASVAELSKLAHDVGMQALQAVNRRAMELQARDRDKGDARHRMNFGVYFYSAGSRGGSRRNR
jgi:hypothetical protein